MKELVAGIGRFQREVVSKSPERFQRLAEGQSPGALWITCSDSRVLPNLVTQTGPGDLFVIRNAGNLVPPHGEGTSGEEATIEYAVTGLGVRDIIVCGHSHCGAMRALLDGSGLEAMPQVSRWLTYAEATARVVEEQHGDLEGEARLDAAVEANVLVQLGNLRTHPPVAAALARGALALHGWVYRIETGEVLTHDEGRGEFSTLLA